MKKTTLALAIGLITTGLLTGCGSDNDGPAASVSNDNKFFNRTASFPVCDQVGSSCEDSTPTAAEIVAASEDGMTLIYSNSLKGEAGFVDIADPANPKALGALPMGGEPTSVTVLGSYALVAVNTRTDYVNVSGKLVVVDIARREKVAEIALGGQPDSVARSKDGKYVAVVIENERDETLGNGAPPQSPAGSLMIIDVAGAPATWKTRSVALTGLASLYPGDPEPEYVSINDDNVAVVTLQENNHIALVDLASGKVTRHFSAGSVTLDRVDLTDAPRPNQISFSEVMNARLREPDGVTWISRDQFVTANEGDLNGGSRGFSIFNTDGTVAYDSGNTLEHLMARIGHYNDKRSDAKGNEPENAAFGRFEGTDYLFVASERSSVVAVYDMSKKNTPAFKQVLPAGVAPEGVLAIPSRNLVIAASENDDRAGVVRSVLNIYQYQNARAAYPTLQSVDRADGTPIPWAALSGMAAAPSGTLVYAIDDSFFRGNRIFEIDTSLKPASLKREIRILDSSGKIAALAAQLPAAKDDNAFDATDLAALVNADGSVNLDPEGISMASGGGFWIASEGSGTVGDSAYPVKSANLILKVSASGVVEDIILLPADVNARQVRFGFEGIAESSGKLVVAFQRAWQGESQPRIGVFDLATRNWQFLFYPLDAVASPNKGWVGLSDITALGNNQFLVVERDNQGGPDARIKRLYRIDLTGKNPGDTVSKTLVRDLLPDLRAPRGVVPEKIEGLAVLASGDVLIVNDNDGVDGSSGETQLIHLGPILK
ncbi:esterase-like activity of phytase family protein [Zoogloea sp.]|uniref:esterase-like activity of phytase family protein n=1 Tax=Zoogloea sp. TaxID=49181 RepID=UPI00262189C9|nr:esterase-like activity of phytase family protein [Zoogloea sp.]MDD3352831.1 esterase-like activity of phytase family protein [Zoogloea sp.]